MRYKLLFMFFLSWGSFLLPECLAQMQNSNSSDRVIYEQQTSYEDALMMREKVAQIERENKKEQGSEASGFPLDLLNNNDSASGTDMQVMEMLKALLKAMGVDELPVAVAEEKEKTLFEKYQDSSRFKKWEDKHQWQGIRVEDH